MRRALIFVPVVLAACSGGGGVLGLEESRARLAQHRKAYEWLAADVRTCGLQHLKAVGQPADRCQGKGDKVRLQTAMQTLGVLEVSIDGGDVRLMTGADSTYGQSMAVPVASWMIHTRDTGRFPHPLTPAPSHWFYAIHD